MSNVQDMTPRKTFVVSGDRVFVKQGGKIITTIYKHEVKDLVTACGDMFAAKDDIAHRQ